MLVRARYASACVRCSRPIMVGSMIDYDPSVGSFCEGCIQAVQEAQRAAYDYGMGLLQICGGRSGPVWDQSILDGAVSFGIAAQFRDRDGKMCTVERWKLRGLPLAVQTVFLDDGRRMEFLWGPEEVLARVAPRIPAGAPVQMVIPKSVYAPKPPPKGNGSAIQARPAPLPEPAPRAPAAVIGPIVIEPPMAPEDDSKFRSPSPSSPPLADGLIINLHRVSGLYWASLPEGSEEAVKALKSVGFRFHSGAAGGADGGKPCPKTCEACSGRLRDGVWFTRDAKGARRLLRYLSPEARQAADGAQSSFEASRASSADLVVPAPAGLKYYPYQLAGIRWCIDRPSSLLADECGLGKSIQILGTVNALPALKRVLVICPASLTLNWRDESKKWLVRPMAVKVLESAHDIPKSGPVFCITNYEMLIKRRGHNLFGALLAGAWDLIAVDEAHRLCNQREAATAQAVIGVPPKRLDTGAMTLEVPGLLSRALRRILATGTPFKNRPRELWPLIHALDPKHFPEEKLFLIRYCDDGEQKRGRRKYDGAANLEELQDRLRSKSNGGKGLMVRRLKADVLPELPPKVRQIIALPVPKSAAKLVNLEMRSFSKDTSAVDIDAAIAHADMLALRGMHVAYGPAVQKLHASAKVAFNRIAAVRHEVGLAKAPVVIDHLRSMLDGGLESVIVFAHHHDVINMIAEGLAKYNPVKFTGDDTKTQKHAAVNKFMTDKSCRVLIGNIKAAGEGITLHRASTVVFAELGFVPGEIIQAEDRAHRIGQLSSVLVQHLVFDGSLDQRMATILVEKTGMSEAALDVEKENEFPSANLKHAAEQRMQNRYPQEVRAAAKRATARVTLWRMSWDGVGKWIASLPELDDRQCDIALRCLKYHTEYLPNRLCAKLGFGLEEKTRN